MKDISISPARRNDGFNRYLKPGALAQILRNARINARSTKTSFVSLPLSEPPDLVSPSQNSVVDEAAASRSLTIEQVPHLLRKITAPCNFKRKKLAVVRSASSMLMLNDNNPSNSVVVETTGDMLNSAN